MCRICKGNTDFPNIISLRKENADSERNSNTILQNDQLLPFAEVPATIQHKNCEIFTQDEDSCCKICKSNRKSLQVMERRKSLEELDIKAKRPHSTRSKIQLKKCLSDVSKENLELKR